mmetsp:Transcript_16882/g.47057  ORF Transcript_16882/g.47057 Transcript_16882/m.47057 type:complete len:194 (+) Transcript_16882:488-1069(+)
MTGLAMGLAPEEARGELERTHLLVSHLASEIDALGQAQERYRRECEEQHQEAEKLREELQRLQADNAVLVNRVAREKEIRERAQEEKAKLQQEIEFDSERIFNSCSSRSSVPGSPALGAAPGFFVPPLSPHGTPTSPMHSLFLPSASPIGGSSGSLSHCLSPRRTFGPLSTPQSPLPIPETRLPQPHAGVERA